MTSPTIVLTVDGTVLTCKGAIAKLETEFAHLPSGSLARVIVNDVPSRIDVRAWAERKGHQLVRDARQGERFELLIAKGETPGSPSVSGAVISSP